uniref:Uncharacterized protein n=1 Tax=Oryza brachyantha TaxID=4533 RepID=J3MLT0_ORYBR
MELMKLKSTVHVVPFSSFLTFYLYIFLSVVVQLCNKNKITVSDYQSLIPALTWN